MVGSPKAGTWTSKGREGDGDAALQAVLKRVAINDEVLVAGAQFQYYFSVFHFVRL